MLNMNWQIAVANRARKQLNRFPDADKDRIEHAIGDMERDPFAGDIEKMHGQQNVWRRRVGTYRIFYEVFSGERLVRISEVRRRTSHTY